MKFNKKSKTLAIITLAVVALACLILAACNTTTVGGTIVIQATQDTVSIGQTVRFAVVASDGSACTLSVSAEDAEYVSINGDSLTVLKADNVDRTVEVTATSNSDPTVKGTCTITITPEKKEVKITISADSYTLDVGAPQKLSVLPAAIYTISFSQEGILSYNINTQLLSVVEAPAVDTDVVVTATDANGNFGTATFRVKAAITVTLTSEKEHLYDIDEKSKLTAFVSNGGAVNYSVSSDLVSIVTDDGNTYVKLSKKVFSNTLVTVTATLESNKAITSSVSIMLHQTRTEGEPINAANGLQLTNDMVAAISVPQIRVDGTLEDYTVTTSTGKKDVNAYDMTTIMQNNRWYGSWNIKGKRIKTTTIYVKGDEQVKLDGKMQNVIQKMYINAQNELAFKTQTTYQSVPVTWDSQHLWNHISTDYFNVDSFELAEEEFDPAQLGYESRTEGGKVAAFKFRYSATYSDEMAYLLTYLCYSFTPLANSSDTIDQLYFIVDESGIIGIVAQTVTNEIYADSEDPVQGELPDYTTYTILTLHLSEIGSAVVEDLDVYTHDEDDEVAYEALATALENIKNAKSYTFNAVETTTSSPYIDPDDYSTGTSTYALSEQNVAVAAVTTPKAAIGNTQTSTGTVGTVGYVTKEAILLANTGKYEYGMDENLYHTEYTGYRQFTDYYEEFSYKNGALTGTNRREGSIADLLPKFNLAIDIFEEPERKKIDEDDQGKIYQYSFVLRDNQVAREFAEAVSMHSYAADAEGDAQTDIIITVDNRGNLLKTVYPYDLVSGTYTGYIETIYSNINATELPEGVFDNYVERVLPQTWADIVSTTYYHKHDNRCSAYGCASEVNGETVYDHTNHTATGDVIVNAVFGDAAKNIPQIGDFIKIFGDCIYTPYLYDYDEINNDDPNNIVYREFIGFVVSLYDAKDENNQLKQSVYEYYLGRIADVLTKLGYTKSEANSRDTGLDVDDLKNRYTAYTNDELIIVFENNHSSYFWVEIYKANEWTLSK